MAIRLREVKGRLLALCAAVTKPEPGDIYIDDRMHQALSTKFALDYNSMGFLKGRPPVNWKDRKDIERIEKGD